MKEIRRLIRGITIPRKEIKIVKSPEGGEGIYLRHCRGNYVSSDYCFTCLTYFPEDLIQLRTFLNKINEL